MGVAFSMAAPFLYAPIMKEWKKYLFLLFFSSVSFSLIGGKLASPDTIYLKKGQYFRYRDNTFEAKQDTSFYLPDSIHYEISSFPFKRSEAFYDSIRKKAERTGITSKLYDLAFNENRERFKQDGVQAQEGTATFKPYSGMIIRDIILKQLVPFGPTIRDTSKKARSWLGNLGNSLYTTTQEHVIKQNLLFDVNDTLNPDIFSNSAKLIRDLPFIENAIIEIRQVSEDSLDVIIVSEDLFPYGIDADVFGFDQGYLRVWNENIFGLGHKASSGISVFTDANPLIRYDYGEYLVNNLAGSFIEARLYFNRNDILKEYGLNVRRRLIPYYIKFGGGLNIYRYEYLDKIYYNDSIVNQQYSYDQRDVFLSRSFQLRGTGKSTGASPFAIISARYKQRDYEEREYVEIDTNRLFHNFTRILGGVSINKTDYYTSNYVYYSGRIEDIPYGFNVNFTGGYEWREFQERTYTAFSMSAGNFFEEAGYFYGLIRTGGYFWKGKFEDGSFNVRFNFIGELIKVKNLKIRNFVTFDYTTGVNRTYTDHIYLKENLGLIGYHEERIGGQKRLFANLHSILFLPHSFYGFRFSFLYFLEFGFVGSLDNNVFDNPMYSGLGIGLRLRNENLVFNALEIRFTFYPRPLPDGKIIDTWIGGEQPRRFESFHGYVPQVIPFE